MRWIPARMRPYVLLARLDRPIGIWLLLLPGWWSILRAADGWRGLTFHGWTMFILFGIGAVIMRAAGCVINDLWDRRLDRQVERTRMRPLACKTVRIRHALVFLFCLLTAGLFILLQTGTTCIILGFLTIPLILVYPLMKRITWWPQLFLGITFNFGALMGWAAITGTVSFAAVMLYIGGICWTLAYDTIYAHQDKEDDMHVGIKSTAILFGAQSGRWVTWFYTTALAFVTAGFVLSHASGDAYTVLIAATLYGAWSFVSWDMDDPENTLRHFRDNRNTGLLVLLAAAL